MPYRSWLERHPKPRTFVGYWLRATFLRQRQLRQELLGTLNRGQPGWNNDEPAVVMFACAIVLRRLFGTKYNDSDIANLVDKLRLAAEGDSPFDPRSAEMLVRDALGEPDIDVGNIDPGQMLYLRGLLAAAAASVLNLDEESVDEIIADSENAAFEHGWKPPIARRK